MIDRITRTRIVPVVVLGNEDDALPLAEALLAGGLDFIPKDWAAISRLTREAIDLATMP